eukprot:g18.t1
MDVLKTGELDDIQFLSLLKGLTDLPDNQIYRVFNMFDVDDSGTIEFDEFYLLVCMLIAIKDQDEKQFLWRHSRTCFELLDEDGSNSVSLDEFETFGFIFNITKRASRHIFRDFDVDDSKELDYDEFRMFTLACLDKQREINRDDEIEKRVRQNNNSNYGNFSNGSGRPGLNFAIPGRKMNLLKSKK